MAGEEGFEPSNAGIKIRCLNQLGDSPAVDRLRYEASEAQIIQDIKKKTERVDTIPLMKRIALFAKLSLAANN